MATMVKTVELNWPQHYADSQLCAENNATADRLVGGGSSAPLLWWLLQG